MILPLVEGDESSSSSTEPSAPRSAATAEFVEVKEKLSDNERSKIKGQSFDLVKIAGFIILLSRGFG